jgi:RNA recognition motif-containing protein
MSMNLYVGNIPFGSTEDDIREIFAPMGEVVRCHLVLDRETNRSKGFAFIEMASDDEARKAMEKLNGFEIDGRRLVVNEARPREPRRQGDFSRDERQSRSRDRW